MSPVPASPAAPGRSLTLPNGMVIAWPGHTSASGTVRFQYGHVTDIAPTLYEAAGIAPPEKVDGAVQQKFDGFSLLPTLHDPAAPSRHTEQIYEVFGNMGLYNDGWMLSSTPASPIAGGPAFTSITIVPLRDPFSALQVKKTSSGFW